MVRGFIFDLDGTVYLGDRAIEGAAEAINALKTRGDKVVFLTNKSIATRKNYVYKLQKMGLNLTLDDVINSNYIMAKYLKQELAPGEKVLVIGEQPLFDELEEEGIPFTTEPSEAKFVAVGWDREFTYQKIDLAYQAWLHQAKIVATNPDRTCPLDEGQIPDCASMIGAIEGTTGEPIHLVVGKPSKIMAKTVVEEILQLDYSQCYMIGDRLETDIKMGIENQMNSVLVLTGITTKDMLTEAEYRPSYVLDSVKDISII
jgi:arabinose operon protein AraL